MARQLHRPCTGLKRGWFATSTVDGTNSGEVEQNVMRKVQVIEEKLEVLTQVYLELQLPLRTAVDAARADLLHLDHQKQVAEAA
jgi:hypothetical protein